MTRPFSLPSDLVALADLGSTPSAMTRVNVDADLTLTAAAAAAPSTRSIRITAAETQEGELIIGTPEPDLLEGGEGEDTLIGGDGRDSLYGHAGNDSLEGEADGDFMSGADGDDTLQGGGGRDGLSGADGDDLLQGQKGADRLWGGSGNDTLRGGAGNDRFGPDDHNRVGDDRLDGGDGIDAVSYWDAPAAVTIDLTLTTVQRTGGSGRDRLIGIENVKGSYDHDDRLTGDAGPNRLEGDGGNDRLWGGAGNDTLLGVWDNDTLSGGAGDDLLYGTTDNPAIGRDPDDWCIASYADAVSAVTVSLALDTAQVTGGAGTDTLTDITGLLGSDFDDRLSGDADDNALTGGAGDDTLDGGAGLDTARYDHAASAVTVSLAIGASQATGGAGSDRLLGIERLRGSDFDDRLTGSAAADTLVGGHGNDTLDGGVGLDTASYISARQAVTVTLAAAGAQATVAAGTDLLLGIEGLRGSRHGDVLSGGALDDTLRGADGADTLEAGAGNDTVYGGAGADRIEGGDGDDLLDAGGDQHHSASDTLIGGKGTDTVSYANNDGDGVYASLDGRWSSFYRDTLSGIENLIGSSADDGLAGDDGDNLIRGGAGPDELYWDPGNDTLDGGTGDDRVVYEDAPGGVSVSLAITTRQDTGAAGFDQLLDIEHLQGSDHDDHLTGNDDANHLYGFGGDNLLEGGAGNDRLLADDGADTLEGGAGDDSLRGGGGADTMEGGAGDDTLAGAISTDGDLLKGGEGVDWADYFGYSAGVVVSLGNDLGPAGSDTLIDIENLRGSYGNDHLKGDGGANVLDGAYHGRDTLIGGGGADTFRLGDYSSYHAAGDDVVIDFVSGTDRIEVRGTLYESWTDDTPLKVAVTGPGGFSADADLVLVTHSLSGDITSDSAAAAIGSASSAYDRGSRAVFVVDNGVDTALFRFVSNNANALVGSGELDLVAALQGTPATTLADYVFG